MPFRASSQLVVETDLGRFIFEKDDTVDIEVDESGDAYISYHQVETREVPVDQDNPEGEKKTETDIVEYVVYPTRLEDVEFLFNHVYDEDSELDDDVDYEEMSVEDLVYGEGMSIASLSCYLTEGATKLKKKVKDGKVRSVRVPVRRRKKKLSARQRASIKKASRKSHTSGAKRARAKSMKVRKSRHLDSLGYTVDWSMMEDEASPKDLAYRVKSMLNKRVGENIGSSRVLKDGTLKVVLKTGSKSEVKSALKGANVRYEVDEDDGDEHTLYIKFPGAKEEAVVESYYDETRGWPKDKYGDLNLEAISESEDFIVADKYDVEEAGDGDDSDGDGDDKEKPKEGDPCSVDSKKGVLAKKDGKLVCVLKKDGDDGGDDDGGDKKPSDKDDKDGED